MKVLVLGAVLAAALSVSPDTLAPVRGWSDCDTGEVFYEYVNQAEGPVTIVKSRVVFPDKMSMPANTTLVFRDLELAPGEVFTHGITGILWLNPDGNWLELLPDGKYKVQFWLTDGLTNWHTSTIHRRTCGL